MTDDQQERERERTEELHRKQMAEKSNVRTPRERESRLQELAEQAGEYLDEIEATRDELEDELQAARESAAETLRENVDIAGLQTDHLEAFADQPYCVLPKAENEYYVVVPRFVPFNVGWLDRQTDSYNVFVVNKYVSWITDLPDEIRGKIRFPSEFENPTVEDDILELADEDERDRAWDELGGRDGGLYQRSGDREIKIKDGSEFDVIASLIEKGNLPFKPTPIDESELRPEPSGVQLDDPAEVPENAEYQTRAWEKFKETGMVGVYWPPGAGKTFFGLYAGDRLPGKKLVVVPAKTLTEQWNERIQKLCDYPSEWEIRTYQYLSRGDNMQDYTGRGGPVLTIYDESHRLPANTFGKLATIDTTYRIGLSASPYREDGRTDYIFALTGYPVGMEWQELVALGAVDMPDATVYLYRTQRQKRKGVRELAKNRPGKTVVFCDSVDKGQRLADHLDVPFIYGETRDRLEKFRENRVVVSSRVGDEGVSLPGLDTVVEYDFHGGSRRQEAQRYGRVMHGDSEGEHIVLMTDSEADKYGQRLHALEEQGVNVRYERRA